MRPLQVPPAAAPLTTVLPGVRASDAATAFEFPNEAAQGKRARSLMQPQDLARRLLPRKLYEMLFEFATVGCAAECGPPWRQDVLDAAKAAGPHVSALMDDSIELIWEDVTYQQRAGFIRIVSESELFGGKTHPDLKISRVAVVPQANRRGRLILNLSAEVDVPEPSKGRRRKRGRRGRKHPSVNKTTEPVEDQTGVEALGTAMHSIMQFMFDTDNEWEIDWQKIDLSDGFWRMVVKEGHEWNFVYQLPKREGDTETFYVVPSSLQMGWKNSPAYFCSATEATRSLLQRILALTLQVGIAVPHRHEVYCFDLEPNIGGGLAEDDDLPPPPDTTADDSAWETPYDVSLLSRVFVDDFLNGLAGPKGRMARVRQQRWFGRATLHAVHAVFPPPEVLQHEGGRDSISKRKLLKGDARWKPYEVMLGFGVRGESAAGRTVAMPLDKKDKYVAKIQEALDKPRNYMMFSDFQKLHGKLQHASTIMPCMKGFMTPLNRVLGAKPQHVGLRPGGETRDALEAFAPMLEASHSHPTHISELVGPDLPHYYGYVDAAGGGAGGTWLPCTRWIQPLVWRVQWPDDIAREIRKQNGSVSNSDAEAAAVFIGECILDDELAGDTAGVSSHLGSDNSPTVGWNQRGASRASHKCPERLLRWKALRQRWTRRGPQDVDHIAGDDNDLGDVPSRSYDEKEPFYVPDGQDDLFLQVFSNKFPLDSTPQLGSWRIVRPRPEIVSAAILLLRGRNDTTIHPKASIGVAGVALPTSLANTLSSLACKAPTNTWNELTCSWPLLQPSGKEATPDVVNRLQARLSRKRFAGSHSAWSPADLETLAAQIQDNAT